METKKLINERRAYRCLKPVKIDEETIETLATAVQLAPSCYNNQPWHFVFVTGKDKLEEMKQALSKGNEWAYDASLIIAAFSKKDDDCIVTNREYHLYDTGISVGFLLLTATELGLVAHPIAGYSEKKAKIILNIPDEMSLINLIIVGKHDKEAVDKLSGEKKDEEVNRPERKKMDEFIYIDKYK